MTTTIREAYATGRAGGEPFSELTWVQPRALRSEYELRAGDRVLGTLHFRSVFGSFATGQSADGCWTFKRQGFLSTRVTVRVCEAEGDVAVFQNRTWRGGGTLELPDGRKYRANVNLWASRYGFKTEDGTPLLTFRSGGLVHMSMPVELHEAARGLAELPWLIMLGGYLCVMLRRDSAAAAS